MPDLEVSLNVSVDSEEEAEKVMLAVCNGRAAEFLRFGLRFDFDAYRIIEALVDAPRSSAPRRVDEEPKLEFIAAEGVKSPVVSISDESAENEVRTIGHKRKGIMGGGRLGRK